MQPISYARHQFPPDIIPLFAAADQREGRIVPEGIEPSVALVPMTEGREVVEDCRSKGLMLRPHPLASLRSDLAARRMVTCAELKHARDGRWLTVAGLVLVRQRPGSASGVVFITIEDETEVTNLIVWPSVFERQRRLILSAGMIGCHGRVQREGQVIHLIAEHLIDLSDLLRSVGDRHGPFPLPYGRGDEAKHRGDPDPRDAHGRKIKLAVPHLQRGSGIKVRTRDFR